MSARIFPGEPTSFQMRAISPCIIRGIIRVIRGRELGGTPYLFFLPTRLLWPPIDAEARLDALEEIFIPKRPSSPFMLSQSGLNSLIFTKENRQTAVSTLNHMMGFSGNNYAWDSRHKGTNSKSVKMSINRYGVSLILWCPPNSTGLFLCLCRVVERGSLYYGSATNFDKDTQ